MANNAYDKLFSLISDLGAIGSAAEILDWDQEVMMPKSDDGQGITTMIRAKELGALAAMTHARFVDPSVGTLLAVLREDRTLDEDQRAFVYEIDFDYRRAIRVPSEFVRREKETFTRANAIWEVARKENDFQRFLPVLTDVFALAIERAQLIDADREPYAVLFEGYERGIPLDEVRAHFARIRDTIKPLIANLASKRQAQEDSLDFPLSQETQLAFHREIAAVLGYDFSKGRIDLTAHPFSAAFGRIATRLTDGPLNSLFSTIHEAGHAMYDHNCVTGNLAWFGTPLAQARGLGVHESQSRLWENNVGRSDAFWRYAYPRMQRAFAPFFDGIPRERIVAEINQAQPGLIRVNADELTYPMHVFLRFEIEQDVLEGRLAVADIPAVWNEKMREYLGVIPPDDAHGCLQDVHWSCGMVGYFPTYVIGSMLAAQEYAAAQRDIPGLEDRLAAGDTTPLQEWLRTRIHKPACRYPTKELIRRATGKDPAPDDYIAYLTAKFG